MTRLEQIEAALQHSLDRCQSFLDTFGDFGDKETQADIDDWSEALRLIAEMKADCVVVPRESTQRMEDAARERPLDGDFSMYFSIWTAMIQAAESEQKGEKL